jgi:hypothetical protein
MSRYIPDTLRRLVATRADFRCEYCRIPEIGTFYAFQIDHITSLKHGGTTTEDNLAYACTLCNRNKGTDLGTRLEKNGPIIRFFDPRKDKWFEHFDFIEDGLIVAKSGIGEATIKVFGINHADSLIERRLLIASGHYSK